MDLKKQNKLAKFHKNYIPQKFVTDAIPQLQKIEENPVFYLAANGWIGSPRYNNSQNSGFGTKQKSAGGTIFVLVIMASAFLFAKIYKISFLINNFFLFIMLGSFLYGFVVRMLNRKSKSGTREIKEALGIKTDAETIFAKFGIYNPVKIHDLYLSALNGKDYIIAHLGMEFNRNKYHTYYFALIGWFIYPILCMVYDVSFKFPLLLIQLIITPYLLINLKKFYIKYCFLSFSSKIYSMYKEVKRNKITYGLELLLYLLPFIIFGIPVLFAGLFFTMKPIAEIYRNDIILKYVMIIILGLTYICTVYILYIFLFSIFSKKIVDFNSEIEEMSLKANTILHYGMFLNMEDEDLSLDEYIKKYQPENIPNISKQ